MSEFVSVGVCVCYVAWTCAACCTRACALCRIRSYAVLCLGQSLPLEFGHACHQMCVDGWSMPTGFGNSQEFGCMGLCQLVSVYIMLHARVAQTTISACVLCRIRSLLSSAGDSLQFSRLAMPAIKCVLMDGWSCLRWDISCRLRPSCDN